MSNKSGNTLKTIGISIIIVLLTIGLSMFMITDAFSPSGANAMAMVGKEEVTIEKFDRTFKRRLNEFNEANGTRMTSPEAYERGFAQTILNEMITQTALKADAEDLEIGVAKKLIRERLESVPFFQDELTGEFSERKMDSVLANNRILKSDYLDDTRSEILLSQIVSGTIAGIKAPLQYAEQRYKFLTEQRKASVLTLTADAVPAPETPSDAVLQAFIDDNVAAFTAPEYRSFTLLRIEQTDMAPDIKLSEEEVRAQYDYKVEVGQVGTPEYRSVTLINATNETLAIEAVGELEGGKAVADVVTQFGFLEPTEYVDAEQSAIIDSAAAASAFSGKTGDVIAVEGKLGWFVVVIGDITPATFPTFEDMREELESDLKADQATGKLYEVTDAVETAFDEGSTIEEAAQKAGASVSSIDYISRLGETQDGLKLDGISVITGVAKDEAILTEVFTNEIGYETDIFDTSKEGYASVRVDDIIESRVKTLDEVRDQAIAMWKAEQIDEALSALATQLKARADEGESLAAIKDTLTTGASLEDIVMVRSAQSPLLGPSVAVRAFEARTGEVVRGEGPKSLTRNIVKVNEIVANADNLAGGFADAMQTQATEAISNDLQAAYRAGLIAENEVRVFDDKLKRQLGVTQ